MATKARKATRAKQELGPLQTKWVEELESGKHRQCKGNLCQKKKSETSYCCLGVACGVVLKMKPVRISSGILSFDGSYKCMSDPSYIKLGLRTHNGGLGSGKGPQKFEVGGIQVQTLAGANDGGATFKQIAAFIRKNPELVFAEPK